MSKTKTEDLRPCLKRKTCGLKGRPTGLPTFFPSGKEGKTVSATNLTVTLSQSVHCVPKVRNAVKFQPESILFQQYRNIIFRDDLVYFLVTNILFLKCISENYDEMTLLLRYKLSLSYDIFMYALER